MSKINLVGQKTLLKELDTKITSGRIAHSYLLSGPTGVGKLSVAIKFAERILCSKLNRNELETISAQQKINGLTHPDLHFVYPVNTNSKVKSKATSKHFLKEWRETVKENPYITLSQWLEKIEIANKKGNISVNEAEEINKIMSLKSYEGGYKVMIIWMAENMNTECANKLLKLIEEPSAETVFLLLTENQSAILPTIKSRCQKINIPPIKASEIAESLIINGLADNESAYNIANMSGGSYFSALDILNSDSSGVNFELLFVEWVRLAFKVKTSKVAVGDLVLWSEKVSKLPKDIQKQFFIFALEVFRKSMLRNYKSSTYKEEFKYN
jgi:DNA polymerase-3 subunit delta'